MTYSFKVEGKTVQIYLREKLLGSVALNGNGETVIEYSEGVMWLPVEQAMKIFYCERAVDLQSKSGVPL